MSRHSSGVSRVMRPITAARKSVSRISAAFCMSTWPPLRTAPRFAADGFQHDKIFRLHIGQIQRRANWPGSGVAGGDQRQRHAFFVHGVAVPAPLAASARRRFRARFSATACRGVEQNHIVGQLDALLRLGPPAHCPPWPPLRPVSALISVDLPTLGIPQITRRSGLTLSTRCRASRGRRPGFCWASHRRCPGQWRGCCAGRQTIPARRGFVRRRPSPAY